MINKFVNPVINPNFKPRFHGVYYRLQIGWLISIREVKIDQASNRLQSVGAPTLDSEDRSDARLGRLDAPQAESPSPNRLDGVQPRTDNINGFAEKNKKKIIF